MIQSVRGAYINGAFVEGGGAVLTSHNPAQEYAPVWQGNTATLDQVNDAVSAASAAYRQWSLLSNEERLAAFEKLPAVLEERAPDLAKAISLEMGKPYREALGEARSLMGKLKVSARGQSLLPDLSFPEAPGHSRWRPHGVMAVIGPYNYPVHLLHTHVAPALLAGNTVVVKPSSVTPWTGQIYAEIFDALGLPPGVFNLTVARGDAGASLSANPECGALSFTGSWDTGRRILEANLDQPHKLLALEMGGKNVAIVCDDASMDQAVHEILIGCCLTAGQRCTATSRLLVQASLADELTDRLVRAFSKVEPGDPFAEETLMGPLATEKAFTQFLGAIDSLDRECVETILDTRTLPGGAFVTPSIRRQRQTGEGWNSYAANELFAPDLAIETFQDDEEALDRIRVSPFGLSLSVFSREESRFEWYVQRAPSGIFNWNRSTNNASGMLPFGGLGHSGNHRPAGISSALYCAHPIAVLKRPYGEVQRDPRFGSLIDENA